MDGDMSVENSSLSLCRDGDGLPAVLAILTLIKTEDNGPNKKGDGIY